ncbi:GNAT family N-acetyltransferase [Metabacillus halosaccharovorans]|uniref:GNAT family N-acetyltransferase n=1 Tax=Metabacillus halosaccharovorans TaxID=930124 RepID=UPI001C1F3572|nr:GNAT family N-acetyltransferase [Metabacillus halosaccharovorans]MBU7595684.1 GNAT family N-acetyltransferase [Metabacillus halosaccharovorans]
MNIREATINDAPELASLMDQLGYPTSVNTFKLRFSAITGNQNYHTLVAELDRKVVGMAGVCSSLFYEYDGSYVRIVAFVVDTNHRRKGIGKKLIQEAESWAKEQGAIAIGLNSGNREERKNAHQFYLNMGYKDKSIGFSKSLV